MGKVNQRVSVQNSWGSEPCPEVLDDQLSLSCACRPVTPDNYLAELQPRTNCEPKWLGNRKGITCEPFSSSDPEQADFGIGSSDSLSSGTSPQFWVIDETSKPQGKRYPRKRFASTSAISNDRKSVSVQPPVKKDHISISMPDIESVVREGLLSGLRPLVPGPASSGTSSSPELSPMVSSTRQLQEGITTYLRQLSSESEQSEATSLTDSLIKTIKKLDASNELAKKESLTGTDVLVVTLKRMVRHSASGTVGADFAAYIRHPAIASWIIVALGIVGAIDGLYKCGRKLDEEQRASEMNCVVKALCKSVYYSLHQLGRCVPTQLADLFDEAYLNSSVLGTASTIPADVLAHMNASLKSPIAFINDRLCPGILLLGVGLGAMAAILPKTIKAVAEYSAEAEMRELEEVVVTRP